MITNPAAMAGCQDSNILDLSFLTFEERKKLEDVLKADDDLRIKDRIRLGLVVNK